MAPTLLRTKEMLNMLMNKQLTYCTPLCQGLLKSLQSRFGDYLTSDESVYDYVLTHPFFKLRWVPEEYKPKIRQLLLERAKHETAHFCVDTAVSADNHHQTHSLTHCGA